MIGTVGIMAGEGPYVHRIRCEGGPLDGRSFEVRSPLPVPASVMVLGIPGLEAVTYVRALAASSTQPGDVWSYVPLDESTHDLG